MTSIQRVVIVGAGIAGLACAVAAAEAGADVRVFEAAQSIQPVAAHVDVVPNLVRDLGRLGVLADCRARGFAYSSVLVTDAQGRAMDAIPLTRLAGDRNPAAFGMLMSDLLQILAAKALGRGVQLHTASPVARIDAGSGELQVLEGQRLGADLIVLAVGPRAPLLQAVYPHAASCQVHAQQWWHLVLPRSPGLDEATWVHGESRQKLYLVPVRAANAGLAWIRRGLDLPEPARRAELMRNALASFGRLPVAWREHLRDDLPIAIRPVREALLPLPWRQGRVMAVGDCAHALVPHFGQSAAQAVEDAVVLGELLARHLPVDQLAEQFTQRRAPRVARIQALTSRAARWDHQPDASTDLTSLSSELSRLIAQPA